ncbi:MAG: Spy/CpxP family protein refolding chaperone [Bacteroidetes bacterium]|nr:Spy/CpxP family protein refolding chaperone [Bacteroidota bacterium]
MRSSNKMLTIAVILLLITNIALVAILVLGKDKKDRRGGREEAFEMMVKELSMTDAQQKDYKAMKEAHMKDSKPLFDSLRTARNAFFALVKDTAVTDSIMAVYSQRISERQAAIDKNIFAHFKKVRNLFTPEQQPKFDTFVQKMMQRRRDNKDSAREK